MIISNVSQEDKGYFTYVAEPVTPMPMLTIVKQEIFFDVYGKT